MHTSISHKVVLTVLGIFFVVFASLTILLVKNYDISIRPKEPPVRPEVGCTLDAKMCPDGTTVGRVGPSCEFSPCPSMPDELQPVGTGEGTTTSPVMPGDSPMASVPDLVVDTYFDQSSALPVKFIVEHRTALNDRKVMVNGSIVANYLKQPECKEGMMCTMMYRPPQIVIADSTAADRDTRYDLTVMMPEKEYGDDEYPVGNNVTITGTLTGSLEGVMLYQ